MDDHGTEIDERAAAALKALSEGRASPPRARRPGPAGGRSGCGRPGRSTSSAAAPRRAAVLRVRAVALVVLLGAAGVARACGRSAPGREAPVTCSPAPPSRSPARPASAAGPARRGPRTTTAAARDRRARGRCRAPARASTGCPPGPGWPTSSTPPAARPSTTDLDRLNLAAPLADGQRLYVPRRGEAVPAGGRPRRRRRSGARRRGRGRTRRPDRPQHGHGGAARRPPRGRPGDGRRHRRRTASATARSPSVDGLLDVRGIGPAKLEALRDLVTVG